MRFIKKDAGFLFGTGLVVFAGVLVLTLFASQKVLLTARTYVPSGEPFSVWHAFFILLLITALFLFLLKRVHGRLLFTLFFSLAMFAGVWFIADILLPTEIAVLVAALVIFLRYLVPRVITQNILIILGISGVAVSLGLSLGWQTVLILAVILAVYDIVAVYWTKHMITLMKGLLARGVIFAAVLPEKPHGIGERLDKVHPREGFALIGTGDFAVPALFVASLVPVSFASAIITSIGALLGFALTTALFLGPDRAKPMPALPPIVLGMAIGFLISILNFEF